MDVVEFEDWLDRLGGDVTKWPDPQRRDAEALLAKSSQAQALLAEALVLRGALAAPPVKAPAGLADRIAAQALRSIPAPDAQKSAPGGPVPIWARLRELVPVHYRPSALLLSLCFVAGILVGLFNSPEEVDGTHLDLPSYVAHVVDTAHDAD
jgi:hypothetical protein